MTDLYTIGPLMVTLALAGFVGALRAPATSLLAWAALFPIQFDTVSTLGIRFAPSDVVLLGLLAGTALRTRTRHTPLNRLPQILGCFSVLLAWLVVSGGVAFLRTGNITDYALVNKILGFASLVASFALVAYVARTSVISERSVVCYCIIGSAWNALGILAFLTWKFIPPLKSLIFAPGWEDRVRGLLVDPNAYGGYVASIAALQVCILATMTERKSAVWGTMNTGLLLLGLTLANSRSAWLAFLCGVAALIIHLAPEDRRRLLPYACVLLLFLLGALLPSLGLGMSDYEVGIRNAALNYRVTLARAALSSFLSSPIWGVGLGLFNAVPGERGYIPHSTHLWLLAETGLVGLTFLWFAFYRLYRTAVNALAMAERSALPSLIVISVLCAWFGLMVGIEALYQRHYWFLIALGLGLTADQEAMKRTTGV